MRQKMNPLEPNLILLSSPTSKNKGFQTKGWCNLSSIELGRTCCKLSFMDHQARFMATKNLSFWNTILCEWKLGINHHRRDLVHSPPVFGKTSFILNWRSIYHGSFLGSNPCTINLPIIPYIALEDLPNLNPLEKSTL